MTRWDWYSAWTQIVIHHQPHLPSTNDPSKLPCIRVITPRSPNQAPLSTLQSPYLPVPCKTFLATGSVSSTWPHLTWFTVRFIGDLSSSMEGLRERFQLARRRKARPPLALWTVFQMAIKRACWIQLQGILKHQRGKPFSDLLDRMQVRGCPRSRFLIVGWDVLFCLRGLLDLFKRYEGST